MNKVSFNPFHSAATALHAWLREWRDYLGELRYYTRPRFALADLLLAWLYLPHNAYRVSRTFLEQRGEADVFRYGETPLRILAHIVKRCDLQPGHRFFELGCGRGRTCFWLHLVAGLTTFGIDYVPTFVHKAEWLKTRLLGDRQGLRFVLADVRDVDFTTADAVYLYGTGFDEGLIGDLITAMADLHRDAWVITASYPLTDWPECTFLQLVDQIEVDYTWGRTHLYLHRRT
ncbi:methyltransferase domain-containing protein [Acanthopleuribacter pedis]|uniref:Class I SAM-dependent methyltransferase n=1 Tax=Acanthopleuribacter pedis TaxID=442870 RepID=A0A8J7QP66_9BACT|nr:class I SAM-dependent methyltransferase [Acanthopleuribacter pedis]